MLSFEPPGPGYFAKVEVWIDDQQGWQVSEERANTEGGSIKLKEKNIKKCRLSFCVELQPYVCSSSVPAQTGKSDNFFFILIDLKLQIQIFCFLWVQTSPFTLLFFGDISDIQVGSGIQHGEFHAQLQGL